MGSKTEETCFFVVLPPQGQIEFLEPLEREEEFICLLRQSFSTHQIMFFLSLRLGPVPYHQHYEDTEGYLVFFCTIFERTQLRARLFRSEGRGN